MGRAGRIDDGADDRDWEEEAPVRAGKTKPKWATATANHKGRHLNGHVGDRPLAQYNKAQLRPLTARRHVDCLPLQRPRTFVLEPRGLFNSLRTTCRNRMNSFKN